MYFLIMSKSLIAWSFAHISHMSKDITIISGWITSTQARKNISQCWRHVICPQKLSQKHPVTNFIKTWYLTLVPISPHLSCVEMFKRLRSNKKWVFTFVGSVSHVSCRPGGKNDITDERRGLWLCEMSRITFHVLSVDCEIRNLTHDVSLSRLKYTLQQDMYIPSVSRPLIGQMLNFNHSHWSFCEPV